MKESTIHLLAGGAVLLVLAGTVALWTGSARARLDEGTAAASAGPATATATARPNVAVASAADEGYCSPELKQILRRVLTSCGLIKGEQRRGCQPLEAKSVAAMSGSDFNALFRPLGQRAAIIQFDQDSATLDDTGRELLDKTFSDQQGASYFLVVSRASPEGVTTHNRELSASRAKAVLDHLEEKFQDPDLEQEVGLLWLGEEFAQLDKEFCNWNLSRPGDKCSTTDLNRSAFIAWIDCRL